MPTAIKKDFHVKKGVEAPSLKIGTQEVTSLLDSSTISSTLQSPAVSKQIMNDGGATSKIYDSADLLPTVGNDSGDFAYVYTTNRLYLWNGSGWYNIALINTAPSISGADSSYSLTSALNSNTISALQVTLTATDPEGLPITFSAVGSDSASSFVDITQDSSVTTITPKNRTALALGDSAGGSFSITFKATDGTFIAPSVSSFTLQFPESFALFVLTEMQKFQSDDIQQSDEFGQDVALSDKANYAIVGAWKEDEKASDAGAAYIFARSGNSLVQQAKLMAGDGSSSDSFGYSVDINKTGTHAIVGAKAADPSSAGAAYIYKRTGTSWEQIGKVNNTSSPSSSDWYGVSVAISNSGDRVVVGSHSRSSGTGAAYVYKESTGTYDVTNVPGNFISASNALNSQNSTQRDIAFNANGTKMFILGSGGTPSIYQYSLSTAYNTSTWTYDSVSFAVNTQVSAPAGLHFNTDGTKMFISGQHSGTSGVWQYTLSTGFNLSTASYSNVTLNVNSQDSGMHGMTMNPAGTKMVLVGNSNNKAYGYDLSTGFDLSTASYASEDFGVGSQEATPQDVIFNSDGTKMMVTGSQSDDVHVYTLSTAYNVSTASFSQTVNYGNSYSWDNLGAMNSPTGMQFNSDGTKFYIIDSGRNRVYQFSALAGYELEQELVRSSSSTGHYYGYSVDMDDDGDTVVVGSYGNNKAYVWTRSGYGISSVSQHVASYNLRGTLNELEDQHGIAFNSDGTKAFIVGTGGNTGDLVLQYTLSTAYDLSTASYNSVKLSVASQTTYPSGIFFKPDGTKMYISSSTDQASGTHAVFQYSLSTAFDLSTASYDNVSIDLRGASEGGVHRAFSIAFKPDGTKMFIVNRPYPNNTAVFEYHLSTAWDISTFSYDSNFNTNSQDSYMAGIAFNTDGTVMYVNGSQNLYKYTLTTGYDVSTASYSNTSIDLSSQSNNSRGITFTPDGSRLFVCSAANDDIDEYGDMLWSEQQVLTGSDMSVNGTSGERFGRSVAISEDGTTILVGAEYKAHSGTTRPGGGYVFVASGTTWTQQAILEQQNAGYGDWMGTKASLSADGNIALLGASYAQNAAGQDGAGKIYVFTRTGTDWTEAAGRQASNIGYMDRYGAGADISSDGRYILVGAFNEDTTGTNTGMAYLLKAPVNRFPHPWATSGQRAVIPAVDKSGQRFGYSVGLDQFGKKAVIGAQYGPSLVNLTGTAYVYENSETSEPSLIGAAFDHNTGVGTNSGSFPGGNNPGGSASRPYGFAFKSDGTKVYICDDNSTLVYQYSLSTPFDVSSSSISYDQVTFSLSSSASSTPGSLQFKTDGTKMYILDQGSDNIYEYNLSTAWDLSTASYNSVNINTSSVEGFPAGIAFKSDGTKMYVTGSQNDSVFQYDLSTAWDLSTASYSSGNSFSVSSQDNEPADVTFNSTGTKMFVLGSQYQFIYQYSLSTAWDVTSASYDSSTFDVNSGGTINESQPQSIQLGSNDSKIFCLGLNRKMLFRFSMGTSIPFNEVAKLDPSDGANGDRFGTSVSLSLDGSTIAVGAYQEDPENRSNAGSVYIYNEKTAYDGTGWRNDHGFDMQSTGQTREENDRFGYSVDIDGDYLISGMPFGGPSVSGNNGAGTAAIFVKVNGEYTFQTELTGQWTNGSELSGGGRTVAISGTRAYVGAPNYDSQKGRVAVYTRSGTTWTHQANLTGASANINFGQALMADGDTAIIGAPTDDTGGTNEGRAFIYTGNSTLQATLVADDAQPNDYFGYSVGIHGDLAVVGAPGDMPSGTGSFNSNGQGAAYVFERSGTTWTQKAKLTAFAGGIGNLGGATNQNDFGWCVDCFEGTTTNTIVVSARLRNNGYKGYVYVFTGSGTSYSGQHRFGATNNGNNDYFGSAAADCGALRIDKTPANNGDIIAIGAYQDDDNSQSNSGSVEVWKRTSNPDPYISGGKSWASQAKLFQFGSTFSTSYIGPLANSYFGHAVAIQNSNLVVGAYGYGGNISNGGAVYAFSGLGWIQLAKTFPGSGTNQYFGQSVASNSDGTILAVGAPNESYETTQAGAVYVMKKEINYNVMDMNHLSFTSTTSDNNDVKDVAFKNDGTKMYLIGVNTDRVVEYDLSTAYDPSSKTYNDVNFLPSGGGYNTGIRWKPDGTKIFVLAHTSNGGGSKTVLRYDVSTPWDISSATTTPDSSYDARSYLNRAFGFAFKPDGTKMFITDDNGNDINEFVLSTAWDVSTASHVTQFTVSSQENSPTGIEFNADGKTLYMAGYSNDRIHKYNLSTAYDLSTIGYASKYISVSSQSTQPHGITFQPDGSKLFLACASNKGVDAYDTSGVAYNEVSKPSRSALNDVGMQTKTYQYMGWDIAMNSSATRIIAGARNDSQGSSGAGAAYIFTGDGNGSFTAETKLRPPTSPSPSYYYFGHSVDITEDGNTVVVGAYKDNSKETSGGAAIIYNRLGLQTYAIDRATHVGFTNLQYGSNTNIKGIAFNTDGTKMYACGSGNNSIQQYTLSTAFDTSTRTYDDVTFSVNNECTYVTNMLFNNDGTKLFVTNSPNIGGGSSNGLFQYNLSTGFDLSTASYSNIAISESITGSRCWGIAFKPDGKKMFLSDDGTNDIRQFTLSTAFDLSTLSAYNSSTDLPVTTGTSEYSPRGLAFNGDGTELYVVGDNNDRIYIYVLTTAYDITTASYPSNNYFSISSQSNNPSGIAFSNDGSKMYIACDASEGVDEYTTTKQDWDSGYKIYSPDIADYDEFGSSVAISGDGLVVTVGAAKEDTQGSNAGALYVFHRGEAAATNNGTGTNYVNGTGTSVGYFHVKTLYASGGIQNDNLTSGEDRAQGLHISKNGEYIIAGAYKDNGGKAFIYRNE